jgi:hypothetical protein
MLKESDPGKKIRKRIEGRIKRLEKFIKMAMAVISDLRQEIQQTQGNQYLIKSSKGIPASIPEGKGLPRGSNFQNKT